MSALLPMAIGAALALGLMVAVELYHRPRRRPNLPRESAPGFLERPDDWGGI